MQRDTRAHNRLLRAALRVYEARPLLVVGTSSWRKRWWTIAVAGTIHG